MNSANAKGNVFESNLLTTAGPFLENNGRLHLCIVDLFWIMLRLG